MRCSKRKKGAALVCALLAVSLTACIGTDAVITSDSLRPNSNVEIALAQQAGDGKNYRYEWRAEDVEATIAAYRAAYMQDLEAMAQAAQSEGTWTQEDEEIYRQDMEEELAYTRKKLEEERLLDPVIGAQEAANLAGRVLEECYGIDLSQRELHLSCANGLVKDAQRLQWWVSLYEDADGKLFSSPECTVMLDATTGEIATSEYTPSYEEYQTLLAHVSDYYQPAEDPDLLGSYGFYKVETPAYEEFRQAISEQLRSALEQSPLAAGASVRSVEVNATDGAIKNECLSVTVTYDNGDTALLTAVRPCANDMAYPLREFQYGNTSYYSS